MSLGRDIAYAAAAAVSSPLWGYRLLRTGKWRTDWRGRFGHAAADSAAEPDCPPTLLLHAVSVGEVNAIRLLVDRLADTASADGGWRVVVTTTTDTGFARAKQLFAAGLAEPGEPGGFAPHRVVRYPLDFSWSVRRFLDAVRPDAVALTELEVWPNFVEACVARGIPVAVVNGRLTARSYARYRLVRPLLRETFASLAAVGAQTSDYAERFIGMGASRERVRVLDTMKWDTAQVADGVPGADELARAMGIDRRRPLIVAGSTAPGEDRLLIETCPPDAQLLLAPRKPEWFDAAARLVPPGPSGMIRRTACPDAATRPVDGARLFLLDTIGELRRAYALADVVVVGRSFLGLYGSDVMEPIALGKPTIVGPYHADFAEIVAALREAGGIEVTDRPGEASAALLRDRGRAAELATRGRGVILSRQGSTRRHAEMLRTLMPRVPKLARSS